jgi:hypothetical protein
MLQKLLNLSNIANILPYYGDYFQNVYLVKKLNKKLLKHFWAVLGGLTTNSQFNKIMYKEHKYILREILKDHKHVRIDVDLKDLNSFK